MGLSRIKAAVEAWRLERSRRDSAEREADAFAQAGARVFDGLRPHHEAGALTRELASVCAHSTSLNGRVAELDAALQCSLANDRADYARVTPLIRWVVIVRGLCERVVLRRELARATRERQIVEGSLGQSVIEGRDEVLRSFVPTPIAREITAAQARSAQIVTEREALLRPYGGKPLPQWVTTLGGELAAFGLVLAQQVSRRVLQRPPAIVGLIVGWWVAHAFTDSVLYGLLHSLGLGGQSYLAPETKARLAFWLPLIAAAFCTYAGARIDARIRRRYAPDSESTASHADDGAARAAESVRT